MGSHKQLILSLVRGGISSKLVIARGTYPRDPSIQIMEQQMENQMEVGYMVLYREPSIQIILTLVPKVCRYYLHWPFWISRGSNIQAEVNCAHD